ncbi:MAG: APC family permease [Thermoplasmatales archaeon]|nr:APC family permease [Thermoplasmatales archaeon]
MSDSVGLQKGKIGLWGMAFLTIAAIYPMAMAVSNAAAAVTYGGFAAPLIPIIGAVLILLASAPILEYARLTSFAGGYYGLTELGFGKATGKFVSLENLMYFLMFDVLTSTAFAYVVYASLTYVSNYVLPSWLYILISILFFAAMYFVSVVDLKVAAKWVIGSGLVQILVLLVYGGVVIAKTHYNSALAFSVSSAPGGLSGLFLGVILAGFLFYTGYGVPLFFSEEGKASFKNVWKAVVVGVLVSTAIGVYAMYSEVVAVGLPHSASLAGELSPGLAAYLPFLGLAGAWLFFLVALFGQAFGGFVPGMSFTRLLYSMGRDKFIASTWLTKLNSKGSPVNAALLNAILGVVITVITESLMILFYGVRQGPFYALFISGSMVVAYWFIHHIIPEVALASYLHKIGKKITTLRNFAISIIAPAAGVVLFLYAFYEGYSSLTEPYFGGLMVVFATSIIAVIIVLYKRGKGTLGESFVSKVAESGGKK